MKGVTHRKLKSNDQERKENFRSMSEDLGVKNRPFNKQKEEPQRFRALERPVVFISCVIAALSFYIGITWKGSTP